MTSDEELFEAAIRSLGTIVGAAEQFSPRDKIRLAFLLRLAADRTATDNIVSLTSEQRVEDRFSLGVSISRMRNRNVLRCRS
jgi:hypothetical protein